MSEIKELSSRSSVIKETVFKLSEKITGAARTALFYGFLPLESPRITRADTDMLSDFDPEWRPLEKMAMLREFLEFRSSSIPMPLMLYHERPFAGSSERKRANKTDCELSIFGSPKSVCEAILIQAGRAILENIGWKNTSIRVNSVGNKESVAEFERRMNAFVRKRIADFPSELRQSLKKDIFYLTKCKDEKYREWIESAPQSMDYLSEQSRIHFKEILEFLETVGFPYVVDHSLIGDMEYSTEIVFEIISSPDSGEEILARGLRWNRLSRKADLKKEVAAASISVGARASRPQRLSPTKFIKPKFYLIQFGPEAKQRSFIILETLRKAGIDVSHSLVKDKLMGQISSVEQGGYPYIILVGQKEALENVAVIRNTQTRSQYTVPIESLGQFIKSSKEFK